MANVIAVSALNIYVKSILESDPVLTDIAIKGEISNFNQNYKSGHCYFSLKDDKASVKAVMFRSAASRLAFQPENGMEVIARCRVSLYERDGAFQIYVEDLFPDGLGAAQMAFEQLKERLSKEGLFSEEFKKPLPPYPKCIGLVTSKTGAALQDIQKVAQRRCPTARFLLAPVTVQGVESAPGIANAVKRLDKTGLVDLIIVARGGGSAEDLWVFNSEEIARAVFSCETPVISAIGHEIDFTILDFVADMRAPTPSAAAEMALPDLTQLQRSMVFLYTNIENSIQKKLDSCYNAVVGFKNHPALEKVKTLPDANARKTEELWALIEDRTIKKLHECEKKVASAAALAHGLNPYAVMARGYGVVKENNIIVSSVAAIEKGHKVDVQLKDGNLFCTVDRVIPQKVSNSDE